MLDFSGKISIFATSFEQNTICVVLNKEMIPSLNFKSSSFIKK